MDSLIQSKKLVLLTSKELSPARITRSIKRSTQGIAASPTTTLDEIFEKKLYFSCESAHYGKIFIFIFEQFFSGINKILGKKTGH